MARAHPGPRRRAATQAAVARDRGARARDCRAHLPDAPRAQSRQRPSAGDGAAGISVGRLGDQGFARRPAPCRFPLLCLGPRLQPRRDPRYHRAHRRPGAVDHRPHGSRTRTRRLEPRRHLRPRVCQASSGQGGAHRHPGLALLGKPPRQPRMAALSPRRAPPGRQSADRLPPRPAPRNADLRALVEA